MDATARRISDYTVRLEYSHLPPETVHQAKRRIIDALGCAMGGYGSGPARIARRLASRSQGSPPATVLGGAPATSPEMAAFANTVMLRYLDCNDTFVSAGTGHPSDMIPAAMAACEIAGGPGKTLITGTVLAYEICGRFSEEVSIDGQGWDQGIFSVIGAACGASQGVGPVQGADGPRRLHGGGPQRAPAPDAGGGALHVEGVRHRGGHAQRRVRGSPGAGGAGGPLRALRGQARPVRAGHRPH